MEVFPTGLRGVDADLQFGGLPAGSVVGVEYPPASAGEAVLWTLVARGFHPDGHDPVVPEEATVVRPDRVVYLTTGKEPTRIAGALRAHVPDRTADEIGLPIEFECVDAESAADLPASIRASDADRPAVVVDAASDLFEFGSGDPEPVCDAVRSLVRDRDGIALLSFAREDRPWLPRERQEVQRCDGHARFESGAGGASAAVRFTHVRGAAGPVDGFPAVFNLDVGRRVSVDTVERG